MLIHDVASWLLESKRRCLLPAARSLCEIARHSSIRLWSYNRANQAG
ncbi:hypothetical protein DLM_2379 [Aquitalea magnusonii]|uniref:Uncharacterized protein n=1 Tax=Aquitalea magnusonii TaxID=332411 RepID=A0A3G9GDP6_9NEIS|nr:hypothetical protein DLM_2379 [Aquitalea magnusonii]